jgi:hypothetical protein
MPKIPEQLLQESSKALIETSTGLRNALIQCAKSISSINNLKTIKSSLRDRILPLIVWLHATLIERRRFVASGCGWSKVYDFCDADLTFTVATLDSLISQQGGNLTRLTKQSQEGLLNELSFLILQAIQGARLETELDVLELQAILDRVFKPAALEEKSTYSLSADVTIQATTSSISDDSLVTWAENVVSNSVQPSVIGLSNKAELGLLISESQNLFRNNKF